MGNLNLALSEREGKVVNAEKFRTVLNQKLEMAQNVGLSFIELTAGELHRAVGEYPGPHHQMANCCRVMKSEKGSVDETIYPPPSGVGASLKIRYRLSRQKVGCTFLD